MNNNQDTATDGTSVVVDFSTQAEFPNKPSGDAPKVELIREQVAAYVSGYQVAKNAAPARIVLNATDFKHCARRILSRMQKPRRDEAKAKWKELRKAGSKEKWKELRKAGSKEKWRDARPDPIREAQLTWCGIPIEGMGYSRHRAVDKA